MKKIIFLITLSTLITGCSLFQIHKVEVQQGNIITQENTSRLHRGMSQGDVKAVMGTPLLVNLFNPNRIDYIYTIQDNAGQRSVTRLTCVFRNGRLQDIIRG